METDLSAFTRRQLEELRERIDRELLSCAIDGREGAEAYLISKKGTRASILLCKPCFERLRLPEMRAKEPSAS
jgi:hypothetical protein